MMKSAIVIGEDGVNTLGVIRSLGSMTVNFALICIAKSKHACTLRFSRYAKNVKYVSSAEDAVDCLLYEFCEQENRKVVICCSDNTVCALDKRLDEVRKHFDVFNAKGEQGRINYFVEKANTFPLAEKSGFNLIKTWQLSRAEEIPDDVVYPCLIKGGNSTVTDKRDMRVCITKDELAAFMRNGVSYLVQEYIEKDYEIDVNGLSLDCGKKILIPAVVRKIRETRSRQSDYIVLEKLPDGLDVGAIERLIREIGYEGLFSIEFLCKNGKFYFLEINLRNDGVNYLYTAAGCNMPYLWVAYHSGMDVMRLLRPMKQPLYLMQIYDIQNLLAWKVGVIEWGRDVFRTRAAFRFSLCDPLPALATLIGHLRHKLLH